MTHKKILRGLSYSLDRLENTDRAAYKELETELAMTQQRADKALAAQAAQKPRVDADEDDNVRGALKRLFK